MKSVVQIYKRYMRITFSSLIMVKQTKKQTKNPQTFKIKCLKVSGRHIKKACKGNEWLLLCYLY